MFLEKVCFIFRQKYSKRKRAGDVFKLCSPHSPCKSEFKGEQRFTVWHTLWTICGYRRASAFSSSTLQPPAIAKDAEPPSASPRYSVVYGGSPLPLCLFFPVCYPSITMSTDAHRKKKPFTPSPHILLLLLLI